jgi:hypothetical protein
VTSGLRTAGFRRISNAGRVLHIACGSEILGYPSLRFKKCGAVWSVRVGAGYRALAVLEDDTFFWYWIGDHDQYEQFLAE